MDSETDITQNVPGGSEAAVLAESALSDWNRPEENAAWAHLQSSGKSSFDVRQYFAGLVRYFQNQRRLALQFLAGAASVEHWVQFEAAAWLNENRGLVGLQHAEWTIGLEQRKTDMWLANTVLRATAGIEFKCIHNNKNSYDKIWELRRDLGCTKLRPEVFCAESHTQFGLAILIYLRYPRGAEGAYRVLGGECNTCPSDRFVESFRNGISSGDSFYTGTPNLRCIDIAQIAQWKCGHAPDSFIWMALVST